jgi:hypothetical protein
VHEGKAYGYVKNHFLMADEKIIEIMTKLKKAMTEMLKNKKNVCFVNMQGCSAHIW